MSKLTTAIRPDYQKFELDADGNVEAPGERMAAKLKAIPLPDLADKSVLDVGCDFGFWSFLAANRGAKIVFGVDRGRPVDGQKVDLIAMNRATATMFPKLKNCHFENYNIGKQWPNIGRFDVVFVFSLYHHIFENCGDHAAIWFWLWTQCAEDGVVLWENPVDVQDGVARAHISDDKKHLYFRDAILRAAEVYFDAEYVGPAIHEPTREVWRFKKKSFPFFKQRSGELKDGVKGATKAFYYADMRRCEEIYRAIGVFPFPGSLNVELINGPFVFDRGYVRVKILEVVNREAGFESPWSPRWLRLYPIQIDGLNEYAFVMRFENDDYQSNFIEIISGVKIRDKIAGNKINFRRF